MVALNPIRPRRSTRASRSIGRPSEARNTQRGCKKNDSHNRALKRERVTGGGDRSARRRVTPANRQAIQAWLDHGDDHGDLDGVTTE